MPTKQLYDPIGSKLKFTFELRPKRYNESPFFLVGSLVTKVARALKTGRLRDGQTSPLCLDVSARRTS
jgi:hypothetical protein